MFSLYLLYQIKQLSELIYLTLRILPIIFGHHLYLIHSDLLAKSESLSFLSFQVWIITRVTTKLFAGHSLVCASCRLKRSFFCRILTRLPCLRPSGSTVFPLSFSQDCSCGKLMPPSDFLQDIVVAVRRSTPTVREGKPRPSSRPSDHPRVFARGQALLPEGEGSSAASLAAPQFPPRDPPPQTSAAGAAPANRGRDRESGARAGCRRPKA